MENKNTIKLEFINKEKNLFIRIPEGIQKLGRLHVHLGRFQVECSEKKDVPYPSGKPSPLGIFYHLNTKKRARIFDITPYKDAPINDIFAKLNSIITNRIEEINEFNRYFREESGIEIPLINEDFRIDTRIVRNTEIEFTIPTRLMDCVGQVAQDKYPKFHFTLEGGTRFDVDTKTIMLHLDHDDEHDKYDEHGEIKEDGDKPVIFRLDKKNSNDLLDSYYEGDIVDAFMNFSLLLKRKGDSKNKGSERSTYVFEFPSLKKNKK